MHDQSEINKTPSNMTEYLKYAPCYQKYEGHSAGCQKMFEILLQKAFEEQLDPVPRRRLPNDTTTYKLCR